MSPEHKIILKKINEILWSDWDPIGVNDDPDFRDEYESYALQVFSLKFRNADKDTIAQFLLKLEDENIGMGKGNMDQCLKIAEMIIEI